MPDQHGHPSTPTATTASATTPTAATTATPTAATTAATEAPAPATTPTAATTSATSTASTATTTTTPAAIVTTLATLALAAAVLPSNSRSSPDILSTKDVNSSSRSAGGGKEGGGTPLKQGGITTSTAVSLVRQVGMDTSNPLPLACPFSITLEDYFGTPISGVYACVKAIVMNIPAETATKPKVLGLQKFMAALVGATLPGDYLASTFTLVQ
ncbi:unnamed protein product [Closterium sp. NIES-54]